MFTDMYKVLEIKDMQIYISLLLLTLNVPLRTGKCTPGWESLCYHVVIQCYAAFSPLAE